jgi:hypothetical protein
MPAEIQGFYILVLSRLMVASCTEYYTWAVTSAGIERYELRSSLYIAVAHITINRLHSQRVSRLLRTRCTIVNVRVCFERDILTRTRRTSNSNDIGHFLHPIFRCLVLYSQPQRLNHPIRASGWVPPECAHESISPPLRLRTLVILRRMRMRRR